MSQYKNSVSTFSQPYNATVKSRLLRVSLQTEMTDFSTLSYTSTSEISTLSITWSPKKVPLSGGAFPYGHYKKYPPAKYCQS